MRRRDILAKLAADAAERARQELAKRVTGVVDRIAGREPRREANPRAPQPAEPKPTPAPRAPRAPAGDGLGPKPPPQATEPIKAEATAEGRGADWP